MGFRSKRITLENLLIMETGINEVKNRSNSRLYVALLDITMAYEQETGIKTVKQ